MLSTLRYFLKKWDEHYLKKKREQLEKGSGSKQLIEPVFKNSLTIGEYRDLINTQEQEENKEPLATEWDLEDVPSAFARRFCEQMEEVHSCDEKEIIENTVIPVQKKEKQITEDSSSVKEKEETKENVLLPETKAQAIEEKPTAQESTPVQDNNHVASSNPFDVLKNLKELNDAGIITDGEYAEKKKEVLKRI